LSYQPSFYERATITRNPVYAAFVPFPFVCFILTFATDVAYALTSNLMWQNFSSWLLFVGLVMGALAAIAGAVDLFRHKEIRGLPIAWVQGGVGLLALALALLNSLVHARDGWTAVIWQGLVLSLATVVVVIVAAVLGRVMMYE
jgi:uncharacterized membrane protein